MFKLTILVLTVCLFSGCAMSNKTKSGARGAFWARRVEADGSEYLRIGVSEFKTRSADIR
jgi:uncharacterized lipoprotein